MIFKSKKIYRKDTAAKHTKSKMQKIIKNQDLTPNIYKY